MVGLGACITGSVFCIKLTQNYKVLSAFCGALGLDGILIYALIYDRGFHLPQKYWRYKVEVLGLLDKFPGRRLQNRYKFFGLLRKFNFVKIGRQIAE